MQHVSFTIFDRLRQSKFHMLTVAWPGQILVVAVSIHLLRFALRELRHREFRVGCECSVLAGLFPGCISRPGQKLWSRFRARVSGTGSESSAYNALITTHETVSKS